MSDSPANNTMIVIDGNSLINRAYYAIQRPMITKDGLYTHAVYGFLNMLKKIRDDYDPVGWTVAFDRKAPTFRHIEYTAYKAQRKGMPPELAMQLPLLKEVLEAMHIAMLEIDGFEADDIIGTVAKRAEKEGYSPLIITGDRDALQLASEKTRILITKKGISEFEWYDENAILEKYGFTPEQFIDYKGLMGDSSDNIPGLPGVGEKTAHKLILAFGSVAGLLENIENVESEKLRNNIEENAQIALMSRRLAEINTNVPIEIDLDSFRVREPDLQKLIGLYQKLEFKSLLKKLELPQTPDIPAVFERSSAEPVAAVFRGEPQLVSDALGFAAAVNTIPPGSLAAIKVFNDHNHKGKPKIEGITMMTADKTFYFSGCVDDLPERFAAWAAANTIRFAGHQLQDDYYAILAALKKEETFQTAFDTAIARYLLQPEQSKYELSTLTEEYLGRDFQTPESFLKDGGQITLFCEEENAADKGYAAYGAQWCAAVLDLIPPLTEQIAESDLDRVYTEVELPLIFVLASMEKNGFALDREELLRAGRSLTAQIENLSGRIYALAGETFNINSPKQLGEILFEKLGLPSGKKNKTGYSTNAEILEKLRGRHEIIGLILEYRTVSKLNSTYVEGLLPLIDETGKIHAHFQQTVTATGRISCTEPNLQNIPIKQEEGRLLRKAFVPESEDFVLVGADYSQIELRVLAHMSQDPGLIEAFRGGADIHRSTAAKVFGVPEDEVTPLQRSNAKAVNFGVIYGMTGFGLSEEIGITRKAAEEYINAYFEKFRKVKEFMDEQVRFCRENGYVTTIIGRRRPVREIRASNFMVRQAAERLAMNSPIQGTAADIMKIAMINCHRELAKRKLRSTLILQVHDELVIQADRRELAEVETLLTQTMERAVELCVVLSVSLNTGNNWYELK